MKITRAVKLTFFSALTFFLLFAFFALDLRYQAHSEGTIHAEVARFDSRLRAEMSKAQAIPIDQGASPASRRKEIAIDFKMKVYSIGQFDNVFQTANVNQGIRLEISKPSTLGLAIASDPLVGVILTDSLQLNKWYFISIKINKSGMLEVLIDGRKIVSRLLKSTDYEVNDVVVGAGFSKTRHFDGRIEDFRLQCSLYPKRQRVLLNVYYLLIALSALTLLTQLVLAIKEQRQRLPMLARAAWGYLAQIFLSRAGRKIPAQTLFVAHKANIVNLILVAGTMSAIIFHYSRFAFIGNHAPNFTSFLHYPINIFADFYSIFDEYSRLRFSGVMNYFPGAYLPLELLRSATNADPYVAIQLYLLAYVVLLGGYLYIGLYRLESVGRVLTAFIILTFSYSVLFTLHTGNLEGICFLLVAFAISLRIKRRHALAASLIGFAASIKLLPAIFLFAIFDGSNKKKVIVAFAVSLVAFTLLPFAISGSFLENLSNWIHASEVGMGKYYRMMVLSFNGLIFGHSLLNAVRLIAGPEFDLSKFMVYYYFLASTLAGIAVYAMLRSRYLFQKVLIGACAICLLPPTSTDYKLQYLLIPLLLLLGSRRKGRVEGWMLVFIALTQIPKGYLYFYTNMYANTNILLNALLLMTLLLMAFYQVPRWSLPIKYTRLRIRHSL